MSDFEFIFCRWQGRLWPARILLKSGISPSGTPETNSDCVDVQIICLDKRLRVKCTDTRPFEEEQAKTISSGLVYREHFTHEETLEELTYRKALRIALNILAGDDSHLPPMTIKEPVIANTGIFTSEKLKKNACAFNSNGTQTALKPNGLHLPQEQGSICTRQSHRRASCIKNTPENEQTRTWTRSYTLNQSSINLRSIAEKSGGGCVEKRKRGRVKTDICHPQKNTSKNSSPQYEQPLQPMKSTPEKNRSSVKKRERLRKEEKSSIHACSPTVSGVKKDQNGKVKKSRQKSKVCKSTPEGNTDYCPSNCKSEEVWASGISCSYLESTPKRGTCDHVGSHKFPRLLRSQRNIPFEKKNDLSQTREIKQNKKRGKKCAEPMECLNASETSADLDANVKSSNEPNVDSFAEQGSPEQHFMSTIFGLPLDEQVSPINGCNQKHSNMDSPHTNCSTAEISKEGTFNASSITKEEGTLSSTLLQTHLGSSLFEIDEVVEFSTPDCLSTSPFTEEVMEEKEEEDDENLPSILVHQEQWSVAEGMLVWCKFQKYPHWPAMVRSVKNRTKKASILFVDENIIKVERNKKGFNVSIRTLKPFDCEERHQFTAAARQVYKNSIDWCVALIDDYRIRRGCGSFTGSFVEYCTAELSIPVRKSFKQDPSLMTFPSSSIASQVEGHSDAEYDTTPTRQQPTKKLLPDRKKAARDRANEKLVQFIVKARGVEKHLQAVMKGEKYSKWLEEFKTRTRNSNVIDTYLEDDWQVDKVINYLKSIYEMSASTEVLVHYERSRFILDVLLPEAIICAIAEVEQISIKKAEEKYMKGPLHSEREVEHFNKEIEKEMKLKQQHLNEEESTS
ncbi:PWWP domain-containing DNA repair factor 3B-like isoform X2 [Rhinoraja longicauda]